MMRRWLIIAAVLAIGGSGGVVYDRLAYAFSWAQSVSQVPVGGGGASVWSPSDHAANVSVTTTTATNDTATVSTGSTWSMVRGTKPYTSGVANKKIFTLKVVAVDAAAGGWIGGVADSSVALTYPGAAAHGYGAQYYGTGSNTDYKDGASGAGLCNQLTGFVAGGTLWVAIDFTPSTPSVWCSTDCITWNGTGGNGNPGTNSNPTGTLSAATYVPAWGGNRVSGTSTAQINTSPSFTGCNNITGFSVWG